MRIVVGTTSEHKLGAVREACKQLCIEAEVSGVKTSSGVNEQPIGPVETLNGAYNRLSEAFQLTDCRITGDICIGIESGVLDFGQCFIDLAVVAVYTPDARRIVSTSGGVQFPNKNVSVAAERGFKTTTVGSVIAEETGCDGTNPHLYLTHGKVSRKDLLVQALVVALSQL